MLKKLLFASLIVASFSAKAQFTNRIAASGLPATNGMILDAVDYNNDGFEDVVYLQGLTGNIALYRNNKGVFSDVTATSGLPAITGSGAGDEGVISFDYNNDGFQDLLIMTTGSNGYMRLFKNNCGISFSEVTAQVNLPANPGIIPQYHSTDPMVLVVDFDKDNDNDILFCRINGTQYWVSLLSNNAGAFSSPIDIITNLGTSNVPYIATMDYDGDRDQDLILVKNTDINSSCTIDLYDNSSGFLTIQSSTGITSSSPVGFANVWDYNHDGYPDILLGTKNVVSPGPGNLGLKVFRNNGGNATFTDVTASVNTNPGTTGDYTAAHVFDINNDGDLDVLWEIVQIGSPTSQPAMMSNNGSNVFNNIRAATISTAVTTTSSNASYFVFDYDNDGYQDIFQPGSAASDAKLFKNGFSSNNYINLKLMSCNGQADPLGAKIMVRAGAIRNTRDYNGMGISTTGTGKSEYNYFGIGNNTLIDSLVIMWPNGFTDYQFNLAANQHLVMMDGVCNIGQPMVFDLGPDTNNACNSNTAPLTAPGGYVTYFWSTGEATPDINVTTPGWYYCTVTNNEGCAATDSVYVAFGVGRIIQQDTTLCKGATKHLDAFPRYDCSPYGGPARKTINAGDEVLNYLYAGSFNGHHYYVSKNPVTWSQAEQDALKNGGHLAVINSQEENDFISVQPLLTPNNLWIGLYKTTETGTFRWVNCDTFEFNSWATGAPSNLPGEFYAFMRSSACPEASRWDNADENVVNPDPCKSNFFGLLEFDNAYNITYEWSNGDTTSSIDIVADPSTPSYNVKITQNGASCFGVINLNIMDPNNLLPADTMAECKASFIMVQATEGMASYLWNTGSKNSFIFVSTAGANRWYSVTVVTPEGCTGTDSVFVSLFNAAIKTSDTTICLGATATLRGPTPSYTYITDYTQDFQVFPYANWSTNNSINYNSTRILGPFTNDSIVYSVTGLPTHDSIQVTFDLYIHDTWEGDCGTVGPDRFRFKNGINNVLNTTFSNTATCTQKYSSTGITGTYPAMTGAAQAGLPKRCSNIGTTTKYTITKSFRHATDFLDLSWVGELNDTIDNTAKCDESWSIDNITINLRRPGGLLWSTGDTSQDIKVTPTDPVTEYWVQVPVGGTYCYDTVLVSTITGKLPDNMFYSDTLRLCSDVNYSYSMPNNFDKYTWSNGETQQTTLLTNEGWYIGWAETKEGCYNWDSIYYSRNRARMFPEGDTSVCSGSALTFHVDYNNDCSPFGGPANLPYIPGQTIAGYSYKGEYRGHHYYLADVNSSWTVAAQNALNNGGHLAIVNDTSEQNYIAAVVDSNAWLGLYMSSAGSYTWMNCDTIVYTNWAMGEPTVSPDDYVFMMATGCPEAKKWDAHLDDDMTNTDPCYSKIYGLMEITPNSYNYEWREGFTSISTDSTVTVFPTATTTYRGYFSKDTITFRCSIGSANVTVITDPFQIIPDSVAKVSCAGDTAMIEASLGYPNYHWNNGDTTRIAVYSSYIGWAYCYYDNGTCKFTDSVYVNVPGKLTGNPSITNITCYGYNDGIGNAGTTGGTPPFTYQWLHNGSTSQLEPNLAPGVYYYTVTDTNGCFVMDSVTITNPDSALGLQFQLVTPVRCNGDTNALVVPIPYGGEWPYVGNWVGYPMGDTLWFGRAGIYTYTVTDSRGCVYSQNDTITEPPVMYLNANLVKQIYCAEDTNGVVTLFTTGGLAPYKYGWNWAPIAGDSIFNVGQGSHIAFVQDSLGCIDTLIVEMVASNPEKCGLFVPAGFTPNGDGMNDYFQIKGLSEFPENELTIFNRWGEIVYHAINYKNDWDGKPMKETLLGASSDLVPNDTYFYILHTNANDKTVSGYLYITK